MAWRRPQFNSLRLCIISNQQRFPAQGRSTQQPSDLVFVRHNLRRPPELSLHTCESAQALTTGSANLLHPHPVSQIEAHVGPNRGADPRPPFLRTQRESSEGRLRKFRRVLPSSERAGRGESASAQPLRSGPV
jgi:hypothetical protein